MEVWADLPIFVKTRLALMKLGEENAYKKL